MSLSCKKQYLEKFAEFDQLFCLEACAASAFLLYIRIGSPMLLALSFPSLLHMVWSEGMFCFVLLTSCFVFLPLSLAVKCKSI